MYPLEHQSFTRYRFVPPRTLLRGSYLVTNEKGRLEWQVLVGRGSRLRVCDAAEAELAQLRPTTHWFRGFTKDFGFDLFRGDRRQASIRESGGQFTNRFTLALADGPEMMIGWEEDEERYAFTQAGQVVAHLNDQHGSLLARGLFGDPRLGLFRRRPEYVLELSPEADPILLTGTCALIDRRRRQPQGGA